MRTETEIQRRDHSLSPWLRPRWLMFSATLLAPLAATTSLFAQPAAPAFTAAQVARGAEAYQAKCQSCHGPGLEGSEGSPPLAGSFFASQWGGLSVGALFDAIATTMPAGKPGTLAPSETADIVAYILCRNGAQPGAAALTTARRDLDAKMAAESTAPCSAK